MYPFRCTFQREKNPPEKCAFEKKAFGEPPLPWPLASPLKNDMSTGLGEGGKGGVPSSSVDDPFFHIPTSACPRFSSIFSPGWMGETGKWFFPFPFPPRSDVSINAAPSFPLFPPFFRLFITLALSLSFPLGYTAAPPFLHSKPIPPLIFFSWLQFSLPRLGRKSTIALQACPFFSMFIISLVNPHAIYRRFYPLCQVYRVSRQLKLLLLLC